MGPLEVEITRGTLEYKVLPSGGIDLLGRLGVKRPIVQSAREMELFPEEGATK